MMNDYKPTINLIKDVQDKYIRLLLQGDMDKAGLESIRGVLNNEIDQTDKKSVVFDFKELNFINSEGIGYLLTVHYHLMKREKTFIIINSNAHVKDVLNVIGLTKVIKCFDTTEEFLKTI